MTLPMIALAKAAPTDALPGHGLTRSGPEVVSKEFDSVLAELLTPDPETEVLTDEQSKPETGEEQPKNLETAADEGAPAEIRDREYMPPDGMSSQKDGSTVAHTHPVDFTTTEQAVVGLATAPGTPALPGQDAGTPAVPHTGRATDIAIPSEAAPTNPAPAIEGRQSIGTEVRQIASPTDFDTDQRPPNRMAYALAVPQHPLQPQEMASVTKQQNAVSPDPLNVVQTQAPFFAKPYMQATVLSPTVAPFAPVTEQMTASLDPDPQIKVELGRAERPLVTVPSLGYAPGDQMPGPAIPAAIAAVHPAAEELPTSVAREVELSPTPGGRLNGEFSAQTATPGTPASAQLGRTVFVQIAQAIPQHGQGVVEITLSPEELGRVRLSLSSVDGSLTLVMSAERAETLELMRRHSADLGQDYRALGFANIDFQFRQNGSGERSDTGTKEAETPPLVPGSDTLPNHPEHRSVLMGTGLDIRL